MRAMALAAALTAFVGPSAARAQDALTTAEAAAKANAATEAGKKYEESIGAAFGREHSGTVGDCAKSVRRPDLKDFDLLLKVGAGTADEVLVRPSTNLSDCVRGKLAGWRVPAPPAPGYWVKVAVALKRK